MRRFLIAAAMFLIGGAALADPVTFKFDLTGTDFITYDPEFCFPNCPANHVEPWIGTLSITLASTLDGVYTDGSILAVTMATNQSNWTTDGFGVSASVSNAPHDFVTLAGGQIVAMNGYYASGPNKYEQAFFNLTRADLLIGLGDGKAPRRDQGIAVLMIPEPSTYALMLGGLGLVALKRRHALNANLRSES